MNTLKTFCDHGLHTQKCCAFGRPVTGRTRPVKRACDHDQRRILFLIGHRCIVDGRFRAVGAFGVAPFNAVQQLVLDADIGECAPHHDLVVATT